MAAMPMLFRFVAACLAITLTGCASALNLRNSQEYYQAGVGHSVAGNHQQAATMHSRALVNARLGGADPAAMAMVLYGYGRELALIGEYEEGIEHLTEALRLEQSVDPVNRAEVLRKQSLLGRVFLDTGRFEEAYPHLEEAYGILGTLDAGRAAENRIFLAKELAKAAEAGGSASQAQAARDQLNALLQEHGDLEVAFPVERFTPEALQARRAADLSPEPFRAQL